MSTGKVETTRLNSSYKSLLVSESIMEGTVETVGTNPREKEVRSPVPIEP